MNNVEQSYKGKVIRLDASSLSDSHCFKKLWNKVVLGHLEKKTYNDVHYGSCWHIFREEYAKQGGTNEMAAIGSAVKAFKLGMASGNVLVKSKKVYLNEAHLVQVCMKYVELYGGKAGKSFGDFEYLQKAVDKDETAPMIEQTFSIPLYQSPELTILFQGTVDEIGKFSNGFHAFGDDKTTSSWDIDDYLSTYQLKPQLIAYAWAIKWMAANGEKGNILEWFCKQKIGGFINGVFLNADANKVQFKRSKIFFFSDRTLTEFSDALQNLVTKIRFMFDNNYDPKREGMVNGTCSGNFGKCVYWGACNATDDIAEHSILNNHFPPREYTPLNFRK
jgi:hypothetical protein